MLSGEELTQRLKEAASAVERADLGAELRPIAFQRALDALIPGAQEEDSRPSGLASKRSGKSRHNGTSVDGLLDRISASLHLSVDVISEIYEENDGQVRLVIAPSSLPDPSSKAAAMRHVSLLTTVGRQAAGTDDYTTFRVMRDECEELGVLDGPNFATEVGRLGFRTRGGKKSREAKANRGHNEVAAELIRQIVEAKP